VTAARRRYYALLGDAARERARDTVETVDERFDVADRAMNTLMALGRELRRLEREARS
jgi:hypothetical protein